MQPVRTASPGPAQVQPEPSPDLSAELRGGPVAGAAIDKPEEPVALTQQRAGGGWVLMGYRTSPGLDPVTEEAFSADVPSSRPVPGLWVAARVGLRPSSRPVPGALGCCTVRAAVFLAARAGALGCCAGRIEAMQRTSSRLAVCSPTATARQPSSAMGSGSLPPMLPARSRRAVSNIAGPLATASVRR